MSPGTLLTTLAVQKCASEPVVKNSAPTVGTPLNSVAVGVPGGGSGVVLDGAATEGVALEGAATDRGVAAAIRDRVQNERAVCCAPEATAWTTPGAGGDPVANAFAIPLVMSPA